MEHIPKEFLKISESGIKSKKELETLYKNNFFGILIGEAFMRENFPGDALNRFLK